MSVIDPGELITPEMSEAEIKRLDDEMAATIASVEAAEKAKE